MKCFWLIMLLVSLFLSACGDNPSFSSVQTVPGATGATGPQGPPGTSAYPGVPDNILTLVQSYNEYLYSIGNDPIQPGLKCTLYTVPNMPATPCILAADIAGCTQLSTTTGYASVQSFTYVGTIDQPNQAGTAGFNILPSALSSLYSTNYALTCTGYFVNVDYNTHEFDVSSDDGSLLYINGSLVVQNDGEHGIADVKGEKYLEAQVYSFQLNYFQGPGNVALIVNMDGNLLPAANLYH